MIVSGDSNGQRATCPVPNYFGSGRRSRRVISAFPGDRRPAQIAERAANERIERYLGGHHDRAGVQFLPAARDHDRGGTVISEAENSHASACTTDCASIWPLVSPSRRRSKISDGIPNPCVTQQPSSYSKPLWTSPPSASDFGMLASIPRCVVHRADIDLKRAASFSQVFPDALAPSKRTPLATDDADITRWLRQQ